MRAGLVFALLPALWAGALPHVVRVAPLGGQAGTTVEPALDPVPTLG